MKPWQQSFVAEWQERQRKSAALPSAAFPLIEQGFDPEEILAMAEVVLSGQLTMSRQVREFEAEFAKFVGAPYAVMVNSGSSANLLALAAATNPTRKNQLHAGDEVIVPAVCWSTSVWPLIQMGLKPVFVDVDPRTLNVSFEAIKKVATAKTKAFLAVHILGNCAPMREIMAFAESQGWQVIEDTCESLGTKYEGRYLGTLGEMGTYSFYFSHHMTTGEGGMVVCRTLEDYDLLKCLRAHGWTRELSNRQEIEKLHSHVDPRFLFVNVGYNLRPMEVQAALGRLQLKKLHEMNAIRIQNWQSLVSALKTHPDWQDQFEFPVAPPGTEPVWFGFAILLAEKIKVSLRDYLTRLSDQGIENRPIVSGNFARQPGLELFGCGTDWEKLLGAEKIHQRGFFIGLHITLLPKEKINELAGRLLETLRV